MDGDCTLTDLILDLRITPEGSWLELDRDDYEQVYKQRLLNSNQYRKANQVIDRWKHRITFGEFFLLVPG